MKSKKNSGFIRNNSRLLKKIGITFVIPLCLGVTGCLIFLSAGWNLFAQTYLMGRIIFSEPNNDIEKVKFTINNKKVYRPDLDQQFATIIIPNVDLKKPILHGDSQNDLAKGVGHYSGSTLPGEGGNVVLSAHRGTAFKNLEKIKIGDSVFIKTDWGTYEYKVKEINIVDKNARHILDPTDYEQLTMYTCYPFNYIGAAPKRFVVTGEYVGVKNEKDIKE